MKKQIDRGASARLGELIDDCMKIFGPGWEGANLLFKRSLENESFWTSSNKC